MVNELLKLAAKAVLVLENVPEEKAVERMNICQQCPEFLIPDIRCAVCGCYLEVKTKSKTNRSVARPNGEVTHCPLGKWGDVEIANFYRARDGVEPLKQILDHAQTDSRT